MRLRHLPSLTPGQPASTLTAWSGYPLIRSGAGGVFPLPDRCVGSCETCVLTWVDAWTNWRSTSVDARTIRPKGICEGGN